MLEIVALSDLATVLCARKFSFDPQGDLPAAKRPQHCVLVCNVLEILNSFDFASKKGGFLGQNPPWGANENFLAHSTDAKSLSATISNICEKIIKI